MNLHQLYWRKQRGASLIEVMIALLVMAMGGSGMGLLMLSSVQGTVEAQEQSRATLQAAELAQLIHANPAAFGHWLRAGTVATDCQDDACKDGNWAGDHLQQWQQELQHSIYQARGIVCNDSSPLDGNVSELACDGQGDAVVKVVWRLPSNNQQQPVERRLVLPLPQP